MDDLFARLVLGHLAGDYLLQSQAMALNKSLPSWKGIAWCSWHCLVYTISVCLFLWTINPWVVCLIFASHWPIDRWSLGQKWLDLIKGRNFVMAYYSNEQYREVDLTFSCIVYTVVDNTWHVLIMWLIIRPW